MSEPDVSNLMRVDEAIAIMDAAPVQPRTMEVPLAEAQGLVLAEDLLADRDYPPFDKALMDGWAVHCADAAKAPVDLAVVGEVSAGQVSTRPISRGEAMGITTGSPLPRGADGVVPVEDSQRPEGSAGEAKVRILRASAPDRYVCPAGTETRSGQVVLRKGARLEAAQLALAAMVGRAKINVFAAPRVGILATGDELVSYDTVPGPAQIRNTNSLMVMALLRRTNCQAIDLGLVGDEKELIRRKITDGLRLDALVISGGMSVGKHDHIPSLLRELGAQLKTTKLRIKPGKPFIFASMDQAKLPAPQTPPGLCYIFGLPGNPLSGFVCIVRLASRVLSRMAGSNPSERWITGRLLSPLPANGPREFYQPVAFEIAADGTCSVRPLTWKGSADLVALASADGLLKRSENESPLPEGAGVKILDIRC